jgi:hypothetical protein
MPIFVILKLSELKSSFFTLKFKKKAFAKYLKKAYMYIFVFFAIFGLSKSRGQSHGWPESIVACCGESLSES